MFLLDERRCTYHAEKPIESIIITDIKYDIESVKSEMKNPAVLNTVKVINRSGTLQKVTQNIAYVKKETVKYTFKRNLGLKITGVLPGVMKPVAGLMKNVGVQKQQGLNSESFQIDDDQGDDAGIIAAETLAFG